MLRLSHTHPDSAGQYYPRVYTENTLPKGTSVFFLLSVLFHCLLFGGMIACYLTTPSVPLLANVVQVDLVAGDLGSVIPSPLEKGPPVEEKISPPVEQEPVEHEPEEPDAAAPESAEFSLPEEAPQSSVIRPDISLKSKPKDVKKKLKDLEPETPAPVKKKHSKKLQTKPDAKKILHQARKRLEDSLQEREKKNQEQIANALARMGQKVKEGNPGAGIGGNGSGTGNLGAINGVKTNDALDLYRMVVSSAISQNWIFNEVFTRINQDLEVRLRMKILQSGEIRDIIYESRSGNQYLDESARKAIQKANPLPPLPNGMKVYDVGVIFTPKGLQ